MSVISVLKRLRIFRQYTAHQIADAETENVMRDHGIAMARVESSNESVKESQGNLRDSIRAVRETSKQASQQPAHDPIAQFVFDMRSSRHAHRRN
jgi:hypothetical protein